jgi:hypothetical protein
MKLRNSFKISLGLTSLAVLGLVMSEPVNAQNQEPISDSQPTAVIDNSGSTNFFGYHINVSPSGDATYVNGTEQGTGQISTSLAAKFFSDISSAMPLSQLAFQPCFKSASFGTTTYVEFQHQTSPDISCPSKDSRVQALYDDAAEIAQALNVQLRPRR